MTAVTRAAGKDLSQLPEARIAGNGECDCHVQYTDLPPSESLRRQ